MAAAGGRPRERDRWRVKWRGFDLFKLKCYHFYVCSWLFSVLQDTRGHGAWLGSTATCLGISAPLSLSVFLLLALDYNLRKVLAEAPGGGLAPLSAVSHGERMSALQEGFGEILLLELKSVDNILDPVPRGPQDELLAEFCEYNAQDGHTGKVEQQDVVVVVCEQAFARDVFAHVLEPRVSHKKDEAKPLHFEQHLPAHAFYRLHASHRLEGAP